MYSFVFSTNHDYVLNIIRFWESTTLSFTRCSFSCVCESIGCGCMFQRVKEHEVKLDPPRGGNTPFIATMSPRSRESLTERDGFFWVLPW